MARKKAKADSDIRWDVIESDYRADKKSLTQIAKENDISRDRIRRRAESLGWERNLTHKINEAARNKLNESLVNNLDALPDAENEDDRNRQIVELAAQTQVELVRHHRGDIARMRGIAGKMMIKLDDAIDKGLEIKADSDNPDAEPMIIGMELETIGKVFNNLTTGYQRLVTMERQAFGMDEKDKGGDASAEMQSAFEMILGQKDGLPCDMH